MYAVIGGALGNLYDRLFRPQGLVIDLFDFQLINFPIFNVADIFISVGGVLFILHFLLSNIHKHDPAVPDRTDGDAEDSHDPA